MSSKSQGDSKGIKDTFWVSRSRYAFVGSVVMFIVLVACSNSVETIPTPTPTIIIETRVSPTITPTPSPSFTSTITPIPTLAPLPLPTPPAGAIFQSVEPDLNRTGWIGNKDPRPHWRDRSLFSGVYQGQTYISLLQFDLQNFAPGSKIVFAALEISGRDAASLGTAGQWFIDLIDSKQLINVESSPDAVSKASALTTLGGPLAPQALGANVRKRFILSADQIPLLEQQLNIGQIAVRIRSSVTEGDNLFAWDAGPGPTQPTLSLLIIPGQYSVITSTPMPENIFAAATLVTQQTLQARQFGTPTPLSRAFVTATPGAGNVIVTTVPTPENTAARTATSVYATAVAATTGTFTPMPFNWVTATPGATATINTNVLLIPRDAITRAPTPTNTPTPIHPIEWAKRPLPSVFYNKIMFLEGDRSAPNVWIMDPDGSNLQLVKDSQYHFIAKGRDAISPDGSQYVYNAPDDHVRWQIWVRNARDPFSIGKQLTFFSRPQALVFGPSWSPDGTKIAFTSDDTGRQEMYIYDVKLRIYRQLTFSDGPWWWNQFPSWSPDGKQIVYSSDHGHDATFSEIWMMNADGSGAHNLGDGILDAFDPVWIKWQQ